MGLFDSIFGKKEQEPVNTDRNPINTIVVIQQNLMQYTCPNCSAKNVVKLSDFKSIIGLNAVCSKCKKVNHIPAGYVENRHDASLSVTGSVKVPISQFGSWYFNHRLVKQGGDRYHNNGYGLWAFCSNCYHVFSTWAITTLPAAQLSEGFMGMTTNSQSNEDMEALLAGRCPQCGNNQLEVIIAEIPNYVKQQF